MKGIEKLIRNGIEGQSGKDESITFSKEDFQGTKVALDEITDRASDCAALVAALNHKIKTKEISTAQGMSFLEVKNNLLVQYLMGVCGVVLKKISGQSIQGSSYVDQLVELRTVLEKMRPIDQKLKYQIDKLVRNTSDGKIEADPLRHRANLDNLNEGDSESDESEQEKASSSKKDIYCPPKVSAQPYDDDEKTPAKQMEKVRKQSINKTLIRELQEEFLETPLEIHNKGDAFAMQLSRHQRDKEKFEETYMTRLPETKKDKHLQRKVSTMGVLGDEITDFRSKRTSSGSGKGTKRKSTKSSSASKKRFRKK